MAKANITTCYPFTGIVDLDLNLESCYVPPPQPEMPTPPNRPSRPSSLYDDKVYATFLPGPHTPVATYVPTKQYAPQNKPSSVPSNYAAPFDPRPISSGLQMRAFSANDNSLPLRTSETTTVSTGGRYFSNATYQTPAPMNNFEKPIYSRPYAAYPAATSHATAQRGQAAEAVVTSVPLTIPSTSHRDELVWSNPSANCMSLTRDHNIAPPAATPQRELFLEGTPSSDAGQHYRSCEVVINNNNNNKNNNNNNINKSVGGSQQHSLPRDRRSWSVQSENVPPLQQRDARRASLASDRLGPCRPTSLTDFKRLLIQTRSQTNPAGERKSATELLKINKVNATNSTSPSASSGGPSSANLNASSTGSVKRGTAIKFNSGIEPIQEEGESQQNSPAKPSIV